MSGPITVVATADPVTALLSAAAIAAAEAISAGYAEADRLAAQQGEAKAESQAAQQEARRASEAATHAAIAEAEQRFAHLQTLAAQLGMAAQVAQLQPAPPAGGDLLQHAAYAQGLNQLAAQVESILQAAAARLQEETQTLPDLSVPEARKSLVQRQLERLAHLGAIPEDISTLARKLEATLPGQQAELLAAELRRAVQMHLEADEKQRVQAATSIIVEQTLKDLGYQVEDIQHTLFVEGGVVHFQRAGWGDYMVRLRVDAAKNTINFNVVRAVTAGENERSVMDHVAEDRWCAEFPALLRALEARGVHLEVTRRLEAGELPVQLVDRTRLPKFAQEEDVQTHAQAMSKEIK